MILTQMKDRAAQVVLMALVLVTLALLGYQTVAHAKHAQPDARVLVADGECPNGDPGGCTSGGGG